jgi:G:T-mismatch repair DNA endonuclease (very short patch repair protein)
MKVICQECNREFNQITYKHLKRHNLTTVEYLIKYPRAMLVSEETRLKKDVASLESFIRRFGESIGTIKYDEYVKFHSYKNSFTSKSAKYGWSKDEFDMFNKSRAVTLENLILKHGEISGNIKFMEYCNKQKDAGCSLSYFVSNYGEVDGLLKYETLNKSKANSLENYMLKYGEDAGILKYEDYCNAVRSPYSKISQKLFDRIFDKIQLDDVYYATKTIEFGKLDIKNGTYRKYDFVIPSLKFCIEFNGDLYHGNPRLYSENDIPKFKGNIDTTAGDLWKRDKQKTELLESFGYDIRVVWEWDYNNDSEKVENEICNLITQKQKTQQ